MQLKVEQKVYLIVGVNWNDYINNAGNSYKDTVDRLQVSFQK